MPDLGSTVFSQTDASNATGTMPSWSGTALPSTIDDAGRALQGAITREWNWRNPTLTSTGSANTQVLTYTVAPAALYNGQGFSFLAGYTNTGATTLNINSLGATAIKKLVNGTATALSGGEIMAGNIVRVYYNSSASAFFMENVEAVGPAFSVTRATSSQSITSATYTKIQFNSEDFDTANCFDSVTNYRFTPNVAGYYLITLGVESFGTDLTSTFCQIYKNGSRVADSGYNGVTYAMPSVSAVIYLNGSTDYIEGYGYVVATNPVFVHTNGLTRMTGCFLRGA